MRTHLLIGLTGASLMAMLLASIGEPVTAQPAVEQTIAGLCKENFQDSLGKLDRFPAVTPAKIASSCQCLENLKNAQGEAAPYIEDTAIQHKLGRSVIQWRRARQGVFGLTYNTQWSPDPWSVGPGKEPMWVRVAYGKFADGMASCAPPGLDSNLFFMMIGRDTASIYTFSRFVARCREGQCSL